MRLKEIELGRACVWAVDLGIEDTHDALEADINGLIEAGRNNADAPGEQTLTELHTLPGDHWQRFFEATRSVIEALVSSAPARLDEGTVHLRAWATRVQKTETGLDHQPQDLHNHSPAFLSGVYFLRTADGATAQGAGTYFANPLPHSLVSPAPGLVVEGREGRMVLFPSWVLHGPRLTPQSIAGDRRVLIAFDAHLIPN